MARKRRTKVEELSGDLKRMLADVEVAEGVGERFHNEQLLHLAREQKPLLQKVIRELENLGGVELSVERWEKVLGLVDRLIELAGKLSDLWG